MACLGIFLPWLSWLKHFVPIPSSDRSYASSARNTSSQGSDPRRSCRSSISWKRGYVPGTVVLPCPEPAHLSKSAKDEDEYHNWQPFSYNATRPIQCHPTIYSPMLKIKRFLEYKGVGHSQDSPICLWLSVRYHNSCIGLVGVLRSSFNNDVSLREKLKKVIPKDNWKYLEEKYGFGFNVL